MGFAVGYAEGSWVRSAATEVKGTAAGGVRRGGSNMSRRGRRERGGTQERVGDDVGGAWSVPEIRGEFGDVSQVSLLAGGMRRRDTGHGGDEGFVISQQLKLSTLQQKTEVSDGGESGQQLPVKRQVPGLSCGDLF